MPLKSTRKHVMLVHMYTAAAGAVEQSIKQSPHAQGRESSCLNHSRTIHTPKASRNLTETFSSWCPEDKEYSVCNHLQTCSPNRAGHRSTRCRDNKCQPLVRGFPLPRCHFLPHLGQVLRWHLMKPRAACLPASLRQHRVLHLFSGFSTYAPWHLSPTLSIYAASRFSVLGSGPDSTPRCPVTAWWPQEISCSC